MTKIKLKRSAQMSGLFFVVTVLRKSRTDNFSYIQIDINLIGISNTGINNSYRI